MVFKQVLGLVAEKLLFERIRSRIREPFPLLIERELGASENEDLQEAEVWCKNHFPPPNPLLRAAEERNPTRHPIPERQILWEVPYSD